MISIGKKKFNMDPKKGIEYLIEHQLLHDTPEEVAKFLFQGKGLNKTAIGDYLGESKDFNIAVLKAFVNLHEFSDMILVQALRNFLWSFRLPGEAQKIDRMMECFAERYCKMNPGMFTCTDTCYVLSFAIIMLNTTLHNPAVKDKPTVDRFIQMNRGINDGGNLPDDLLTSLYESIKKEPFKIPEDDSKVQAMDNYGFKCKTICKPIIIAMDNARSTAEGSIKADIDRLKKLFIELKFEEPDTSLCNKSKGEILKELLKMNCRSEFTSDVNLFLCVILGKGNNNGCFLDNKDNKISIEEVVYYFNTENCIGLREKPKIFFIQTDDDSLPFDPTLFGGGPTTSIYSLPTMADIFIYHCSIPVNFESETFGWDISTIDPKTKWNPNEGSKFINTLCDEIIGNPCIELHTLTIKVNKELSAYIESIHKRKLTDEKKELAKLELPVCTSQLRMRATLCPLRKD